MWGDGRGGSRRSDGGADADDVGDESARAKEKLAWWGHRRSVRLAHVTIVARPPFVRMRRDAT